MHIGGAQPTALMNSDPELLVLEVLAVAAVRRDDLEGGGLEAFEAVCSSRRQPAESGTLAAVQHRCPELLPLGERAAVQDDHRSPDRLPGAAPDAGSHVLPGDVGLTQLPAGDDLILAVGQLSKHGGRDGLGGIWHPPSLTNSRLRGSGRPQVLGC